MQKYYNKKRTLNKLKASLLLLMMAAFAIPAQAQTRANEIRMKTGTETITDAVIYNFYDSGGPYVVTPPELDPNNEYNWVSWYQHNESYLLHLTNPLASQGKGIMVTFNYLLINNDHLYIYDGDLENSENLIVHLTNNDYSTGYGAGYTVMSHGNMTIRFTSDYHWRDAGWEAAVKLYTYAPKPPVALMQACDNYVELLNGSQGTTDTKVYYTLDGTDPEAPGRDPLSAGILYEGPFQITSVPTTVKAITVENNTDVSAISTYTFTKLITPPGAPTITHIDGTNKVQITAPEVPSDQNDTYYVRFSTNGDDPQFSPSTMEHKKDTIIELTEPCTVKAVTRGTTCDHIFSEIASLTVSEIYVPTPVITINGTGNTGTVEISCSLSTATIYYTTDGSDPTTSSTVYSGSFTVPAGTTVKAMAYKEGSGYVPSNIASAIYIPGGAGSGVYSNVVLLDDREPHTWSYYSDGDQPVHSLKPADVKITYFGNGVGTVTNASENGVTPTSFSLNATTVAVSGYEPANQFVYLKTLENADTEGMGNYPYTLIPNPFSKRPTVGDISISAGATCWRGFFGWRVKSLSNGLSIKDGEATLGVGSIIPAETEIEFVTSNAEGNEVEFEALWAQAWFATTVNNTTNLNANVTYERNFIRIAEAINTTNSRPATIMELYPNGTTDGSTAATAAPNTSRNLTGYSLSADTKFEFIALNRNSGTMTANNHYLCFGRGINASRNAARIQGINQYISGQTNYSNLDYTIRVESGQYDQFAFVRSSSATVSGRVQVKSILGCDYDRAEKNSNSNYTNKLSVSANSSLFYSTNVTFSGQSNKDQKTFDLVVKSGEYQRSHWSGANADGQYNHSLYLGPNSAGASYPGVRYVTIEGGEFASMNGGRASNNMNNASADVVGYYARIKDGIFHGAVFGGAADNNSPGGRSIIITGGTVLGWVAGGGNGTGTGDSDAMANVNGNTYIYVGGDAIIGGTGTGTMAVMTVNETLGGQVFGAGRGKVKNNGTSQTASVINSNVVISDNATITSGSQANGGNVYGGGNLGIVTTSSNVYILGGAIQNHVFGGAYGNANTGAIPVSNVYVKGGTVNGSVYGGSNYSGTVTNANVTMTSGTTTNVYGAGLGNVTNAGQATTNVAGATVVKVSGGTINNNVYGGGALGTVTNNTSVTVSGGTMKNIFGAGQGRAAATGVTAVTANIGGTTSVIVKNNDNGQAAPTIAESVYGGGENGNVKQAQNPNNGKGDEPVDPRAIPAVSTVEITGGNIAHNVFGGGSMGFTNGGTVVNMSGGNVEGSVFGGAFGTNGRVYVAGQRTVNMRSGTVNKHVYGGSRNADDALTFNPGSFNSSIETATASVVNMSGGYVHYQVFASGYFGNVFGSTYAFIGTNAIMNAPYHVAGTNPYNQEYYNHHTALRIGGSVWAGGDFGNYDGSKFGDPTISGRSNVYVDGTGYDTESNNTGNTNYMYIGNSIYGSGTSCDAGKQGRQIIVRNYGTLINASAPTAALPYSSATRSLYSIQRADNLTIDNSHIVFLGEGKINSLVTTEKYGIHEFQLVRMANGSSIFLNYPADQIKKFGSYTCPDVYDNEGNATYTPVNYDGLGTSAGPTDNKIRVNNGAYIQIKYIDENNVEKYGELEGFAHMMSDDANNTCAYARPKQSTDNGNTIPNNYDNPDDGGFVSYDQKLNTYNVDGGTVVYTSSDAIQMPYENHTLQTKNGEDYFRIWRAGGDYSYREGVFVAQSRPKKVGEETTFDYYSTVDVVINLPAFEACEEGTAYYRIQSLSDGNTTINYGTDVMTVNAACYGDVDANNWMYIDGNTVNSNFVTGQTQSQCSDLHYIKEMPNVNFGLVAIPTDGLEGNDNMIICETSDKKIAAMHWTNKKNEKMPKVTFRLTYHNNLTNNVVWDPMTITFEQVNCSGQVVATVDVALTVTTLTNIDQDFLTQAYAVMRGNGHATDTYTAKVVLPQYVMHVNTVGEISEWTCQEVTFDPEAGYSEGCFVGGTDFLNANPEEGCNNLFGMKLSAGLNFDNTTGWESGYDQIPMDMYNWPAGAPTGQGINYVFGSTTARDPIGFDFELQFDGRQKATSNYKVGTLNFKMKFTNYEGAGAEPYSANLNIKIEVWILGQGANYYIDGVHGNNLYSGRHPNAAKQTLSGIFNRTDYVAGDYIFVVDQVTANDNSTLMWNGKAYSEVTLYRYPGGHECVQNVEGAESHYNAYVDRPYLGPLVSVEKNMEMTGIVLNGFYEESLKPEGQAAGDLITGDVEYYHKYQPANAPLVEIKNGGRLSVYGSSRMEHNYNATTDGGGVYIEDGGVLNLYDGSAIDTNYVATGKNGGGIYVNETSVVQLSDVVNITGNQQMSTSKADEGTDNNVYLSTYNSHVNVGTSDTDDPYTMLLSTAKVGITKNPNWGNYYYAPVAYSDGGQAYLGNLVTENAPETGAIMWDDQTRYEILSLNNTHLTNPTNYVYFVGTWVTEVTENPQDTEHPDNFDASQIDTPQELAWLISYVNGLNGATAHPGATATLTGDIDMSANIWVPITNFTGSLEGNGHVVTGLRSPLNNENMGMFGVTNGATISNLVAQSTFAGGSVKNLGTLIGTMNGGMLSNVEAAGRLTGTNATANIGGLVGEVKSGTIHSAFAVDTIAGGTNTVVGGLVGTNGGNLYNSYSNITLGSANTATNMAGLVGVNTGTVENCYVVLPEGFDKPAFVHTNQVTVEDQTTKGNVNYCYAADGTTSYVGADAPGNMTGHGTYDAVKARKAIGYLYDDNAVTAKTADTTYVRSKLTYNGKQIATWPGLLSTLNQWVTAHTGYTPWFRPTSGDINGDLPVLGFTKDNSLATQDGKFLYYGAYNLNPQAGETFSNGLDNLFTKFDGKSANMFLYGNATDVTLGNGSNMLFINEDAVLLQSGSNAINATVGVTFDNSDHGQNAYDYYGNKLLYDWHFMSSPLADAPIGATYGQENGNHGNVNLSEMTNGYFPNGLTPMDGDVLWDFYSYYEPEYHWINLKRTDHFHMDGGASINYTNETNFVPGKGYMMAISQDSYMSNSGVLNNGNVPITLTNGEPDDLQYNKGWNLVGNPYQAYLDVSTLGTIYGYDADMGVYAPYSTSASVNPAIPAQNIHPHQAFFYHAATDGATLTFTPTMATTTEDPNSYFRAERVNYPLVNLFVQNAAGNRDLTVVEFNRPELGGATKVGFMTNANFQIAAHLDGENYGMLFTPENTEKVPVRFYTDEDGTFTLTWSTFNGDFTSLLLVDNMTGTITDMLRSDHYTFDAKTSDYASRFYLTYACTGVEEVNEGDGSFAFFDGSEWVVNGKGQLDIIDVTGRVLFSKRIANEQNRVNLNNVAPGVYMMRVSDGKDTMVQKIVVR